MDKILSILIILGGQYLLSLRKYIWEVKKLAESDAVVNDAVVDDAVVDDAIVKLWQQKLIAIF